MKKFIYILSLALIFILFLSTAANAHIKPDDISVSDYSGVLSDGVKSYIKSKNELLSASTGAKIIFVTTEGTDGAEIDEYCKKLYASWGISSLGRNNNIIITIDTNKKEYSFERGRGIRLAIAEDEIYQYIIDSFEPYFANENYDKAVMSLYNALGSWYENQYSGLKLGLDDNIQKYTGGNKTKDTDPQKSMLWIWITAGVVVVACIVLLKIKRNIELKYRKIQRRRLRKKFQIDVDKIINS